MPKSIVEINLPSRKATVHSFGTPNVFASFTGSGSQCSAIANLLNGRMAQMEDRDREIPVSDDEIEAAAECKIDNWGNCLTVT